jgi:glycine/D-amino acid oxidase-like deaminating enzyme
MGSRRPICGSSTISWRVPERVLARSGNGDLFFVGRSFDSMFDLLVECSPVPPATLFQFRAPAGLARTVVNTPDFDLRQVATDRLLAVADSPHRTLGAVRSTFRGAANVELFSTRVGVRPMPAEGEPIVGPVAEVPGLYVAVLHSAVTLTPAVGRLVARELVDGAIEPVLAGCRLDRF